MKKGFTVLELVIVIATLIILIGIAIPRVKGMHQASNIDKVKGELQTLETAIESYYNNGSPHAYPASSNTPCVAYFDSAKPQVISSPLYDPFGATGTTEYVLKVTGSYYVFGSVGTGTDLSTLAISSSGAVTKANGNICITNGSGCATSAATGGGPTGGGPTGT